MTPASHPRPRRPAHLPWAACLLLCLAALGAACTPQTPPPVYGGWHYTDLRLVSPSASAAGPLPPGRDLVAVYQRTSGAELQIRLDFLDLDPSADFDPSAGFDLYLAFAAGAGPPRPLPGGGQAGLDWQVLLTIPARGPLRLERLSPAGLLPIHGLALRLVRDPLQDNLEIAMNRQALGLHPTGFYMQALIAAPGSPPGAERSAVIWSGDAPPPPAPLLLVFSQVFPAYTPAQALRRWDGAHTGPLGAHHGLSNLLRAAETYQAPLLLLDLQHPLSLSALDLVGALPWLRRLTQSRLLLLPAPDLTPCRPLLPPGPAAAASPLPPSPPGAAGFAPLLPSPLGRGAGGEGFPSGGEGLLPALTSPDLQPTSAGPSLALRRLLVQAALDAAANPSHFLAAGGSLPASSWGDPQVAAASLAYFRSHPWIRLLTPQDLQTLPGSPRPAALPLPETSPSPGGLAAAAWQACLALYAPTYPQPPELPRLRQHYTGGVQALLQAAAWQADPRPAAGCAASPGSPALPACRLASQDVLAFFDAPSAALTHLFVRTPGGVHQLVGPSSQLVLGQSDPAAWDFSAGPAADPGVIPGALYAPRPAYQPQPPSLPPETALAFSASDGSRRTYRLLPNGLRLEVHAPAQAGLSLRIPLLFDPWRRFTPDWADGYQLTALPGGWQWSAAGSGRLDITASLPLHAYSFLDSRPLLAGPENPDQELPPGHFLPFPLALVELVSQPDYWLEISLHSP
jgi:hypothetical protein